MILLKATSSEFNVGLYFYQLIFTWESNPWHWCLRYINSWVVHLLKFNPF